jgi:ribosomal RNA-processing protein 8
MDKSSKALRVSLKGARFRFLNEKLYTITSQEAVEHFKRHPDDYDHYHEGFRAQIAHWPFNPVDLIILKIRKIVSSQSQNLSIADMGCGDAKIRKAFLSSPSIKVHSFDLVENRELGVEAVDICNTPLQDCSIDIVVFSLSLMNTNYPRALEEARRVLKPTGRLIIAEVESRMKHGPNSFISEVTHLGFRSRKGHKDLKVFLLFDFIVNNTWSPAIFRSSSKALGPCAYKKR